MSSNDVTISAMYASSSETPAAWMFGESSGTSQMIGCSPAATIASIRVCHVTSFAVSKLPPNPPP